MGAATKVWVKVAVLREEWREVHAVTLDEAEEEAAELPGVALVLTAQYHDPKPEPHDSPH